jgi:hypothetical protein
MRTQFNNKEVKGNANNILKLRVVKEMIWELALTMTMLSQNLILSHFNELTQNLNGRIYFIFLLNLFTKCCSNGNGATS